MTSVLLLFICNPIFLATPEKVSTSAWILAGLCATRTVSSANRGSQNSSFLVFVFALKRNDMKSSVESYSDIDSLTELLVQCQEKREEGWD